MNNISCVERSSIIYYSRWMFLTVDLRLCVSCCTKQLSLTPAFPRDSATVSRVKGSCHKTGWVNVCGCVCVRTWNTMLCLCTYVGVCADSLSKGSGFYPVSVQCSHLVKEQWKGHYSLQQQQTESPFSTPEGLRERPSVSACELRGERWPLTLKKATEMERGQACVHLPLIILALLAI